MQKLKLHPMLTLAFLCLVGIGISEIFSASSVLALKQYGDINYFLKRQIMFVVIGFVVCYFCARYPYDKMRTGNKILYLNLFCIFLLLLVHVPGIGGTANGATRWISIGPLSFQPSEVAKLVVIFTVSHMMDVMGRERLNRVSGLLRICIYLGIICGLIASEKHLSAIMLIGMVVLSMLMIGGLHKKYFIMLGGLLAFVSVVLIKVQPFRIARILGFLHPEQDPEGKGFHILQSFYALGSGNLFGMGLGMSRQKFFWLPENYTDFILAIIGEENGLFGIAGVATIIVLFILFVVSGFIIAYQAKNKFGLFLASGVSLLLFFQAFINMAVVSGLFPVTGMPLPFISYGGSSTVILFAGVGLIYNVASKKDV